MPEPGGILSHQEMSGFEGKFLQKGMNYRIGKVSVLLMSRRPGALYPDRIEDDGTTLIYEGHDISADPAGGDPKTVDQPLTKPDGKPSDNAKFLDAAKRAKQGVPPIEVHVYEKMKTNIWTFVGRFRLVDAWSEPDGRRRVFKFKLRLIQQHEVAHKAAKLTLTRIIPSAVKVEVWKRDKGRCRTCGATDNLHFDHILPFSKGGTSVLQENVQILCARHNLSKRDNIG